VALGKDSVAIADDIVSVGSVGATRRVSNVTDAIEAQDAVTLAQLQAEVKNLQKQIKKLRKKVKKLKPTPWWAHWLF
jgi:peptidoglycan hydrolase CwlO-like protein